MKLLVIGFGSIGARHARIAKEEGLEVACVTKNEACPYARFSDIESALNRFSPDLSLISNETASHLKSLSELDRLGFAGRVLVEKPLDILPRQYFPKNQHNVFVAYNLRFHPLLIKLKKHLAGKSLYSAEFHVGQYLPDWRPGSDYKTSYSSFSSQGGGVLRDLSHEIDLALWLCGDALEVTALGGHISNLDIESDDVFAILSRTRNCPVMTVAMNYLDRPVCRSAVINGFETSVKLDLPSGKLLLDGSETLIEIDRDYTYREQIRAFAFNPSEVLCSFLEGEAVMRFIQSAEQSAKDRSWRIIE